MVFLTGGSGTLGSELIKLFAKNSIPFYAPSSCVCNIVNYDDVRRNIAHFDCDVVIHCAAVTDVKGVEEDPSRAYDVNVIGTINVIKACRLLNKRLVFISTEHVFDGEKGYYSVDDYINPLSRYAKTKTSAELLVRTYDNSLVIRTSFFGHDFPYDSAFVDQWSSKDYVDIIAPLIFKEVFKNKVGVCHVGSKRRSLYEIAKLRKPNVKQIKLKDCALELAIPKDTSLLFNAGEQV